MNRRKFLFSLMLLTGGAVVSYYGYKYIRTHQNPNYKELASNKELIAELADVIIPRTDTPGAKDVRAEEFIVHIIHSDKDVTTTNNFIQGLEDVKKYVHGKYEKDFVLLSLKEKIETVNYFRSAGQGFSGFIGKIQHKIYGKSFYEALHEYTCIAYCTSQEGATRALAYQAIPSTYIAVNKLGSQQRSWATK